MKTKRQRTLSLSLLIAVLVVGASWWGLRHLENNARQRTALRAENAVSLMYAHVEGDRFSYDLANVDAEKAVLEFQASVKSHAQLSLQQTLKIHMSLASTCRYMMERPTVETVVANGMYCFKSAKQFRNAADSQVTDIGRGH